MDCLKSGICSEELAALAATTFSNIHFYKSDLSAVKPSQIM